MLCEMTHQVLLVEDDAGIAMPVLRTLAREDYQVEHVTTGTEALERAARGGIDLILLDLGLPDLDGLEVCRQLRADGFQDAIMILTARGGEIDRVVGLDVGADDYLAKPFPLGEFLARIRALLRRATRGQSTAESSADAAPANAPVTALSPVPSATAATPAAEAVVAPRLRVDVLARRVWVDETELALTTKEFGLISLLAADRGVVVTREELMDKVWDENWFGSTKTLDVTMARLRQKLDAVTDAVQITTLRGVGFRLELE